VHLLVSCAKLCNAMVLNTTFLGFMTGDYESCEKYCSQFRAPVPKEDDAVRESIHIPFPYLARRTKKQMELDPKMVEIFKKVEVTIPLLMLFNKYLNMLSS